MYDKCLSPEEVIANKEDFKTMLLRELPQEESQVILEYLEGTDIYTAPASCMYHGSYTGGLAEHCLGVADWLVQLNEMTGNRYSIDTCLKVGLLHDLCKVGIYHKEKKNVKIGGVWEERDVFVSKENYPFGHGEKSVFLLQEIGVKVSREEALAIRHHMGAYNLSGNDLKTYSQAIEECPLVLLLHTADMLESRYGISQ